MTFCCCSFLFYYLIRLEPVKSTPNLFVNLEKTVRRTVLQCVALPCESDYQLQRKNIRQKPYVFLRYLLNTLQFAKATLRLVFCFFETRLLNETYARQHHKTIHICRCFFGRAFLLFLFRSHDRLNQILL